MAKGFEWYEEFFDEDYTPSKNDLVALFYFELQEGVSVKEAIGRIASESSVGTWTTLADLPKRALSLKAYGFWYKKFGDGYLAKVAYPLDVWEEGSIPNLLSGAAGNIFGMKALKNLRLIDISFPKAYLKHFHGPSASTKEIKRYFKIKKRPLLGAVPKPKIGYSAKEHAWKVGLDTWLGGFDCVKDDENLANQKFNRFYERVRELAKARDKAESETGEVKDAFINVTAPSLKELERRILAVFDHGFRYFMIDVVVSGFTAVQTAADLSHDLGMFIHGHRAMHAAFTRNPKHGISMPFIAKLSRLAGINQIHTGTVVGKLEGKREESLTSAKHLRESKYSEELPYNLSQDWGRLKNAFPVASGGLHPGIVPDVLDIYGSELVLLVSGGIHGHPKGTKAGAQAVLQALEAYYEGIPLEDYAKTHKELAEALKKWGRAKPI